MTAHSYEFDYVPTPRDVMAGVTRLDQGACRGGLWWQFRDFGILRGKAYGVFAFVVASIIVSATGWATSKSAILWYLIAFVIGFAILMPQRLLRRRSARVYVGHVLDRLKPQTS